MLSLGALAFATPWVLAALAALPIIWVIASLGGDAPLDQTVRMAVYAGLAGIYVLISLNLVQRWPPLARPA